MAWNYPLFYLISGASSSNSKVLKVTIIVTVVQTVFEQIFEEEGTRICEKCLRMFENQRIETKNNFWR